MLAEPGSSISSAVASGATASGLGTLLSCSHTASAHSLILAEAGCALAAASSTASAPASLTARLVVIARSASSWPHTRYRSTVAPCSCTSSVSPKRLSEPTTAPAAPESTTAVSARCPSVVAWSAAAIVASIASASAMTPSSAGWLVIARTVARTPPHERTASGSWAATHDIVRRLHATTSSCLGKDAIAVATLGAPPISMTASSHAAAPTRTARTHASSPIARLASARAPCASTPGCCPKPRIALTTHETPPASRIAARPSSTDSPPARLAKAAQPKRCVSPSLSSFSMALRTAKAAFACSSACLTCGVPHARLATIRIPCCTTSAAPALATISSTIRTASSMPPASLTLSLHASPPLERFASSRNACISTARCPGNALSALTAAAAPAASTTRARYSSFWSAVLASARHPHRCTCGARARARASVRA